MYTDLSLFIFRFLYNIVTVLASITMEISDLKTLSEFKVINLFCRIKIPTNYLQKIIKKRMERIAGHGTVMTTCTLLSV